MALTVNLNKSRQNQQRNSLAGDIGVITATTTTAEFELRAAINFIQLGVATTGGILVALQYKDPADETNWVSTGITATSSTSTTVKVIINSDTLSAIAGLCIAGQFFRLLLAASDTMAASYVWSRIA